MSFWDWLGTPSGVALLHALIVLMLAMAAWISELARRSAAQAHRELHDHIATCPVGTVPDSAEHD